jgi:nitroreductase
MSLDIIESRDDLGIFHLPPPQTKGGPGLMEVLTMRRSTRAFSGRPLSPQMLSDLLWCANGINRPESGGRTAPSARNWQEIDLYVALESGTFVFEPGPHRLRRVHDRDIRARTGQQDFVATAAVDLVMVADLAKISSTDPTERRFYSAADAGLIAANIYLFCAGAGLGTVMRGLIDRRVLARELGLSLQQRVLFAQTVGYPAP